MPGSTVDPRRSIPRTSIAALILPLMIPGSGFAQMPDLSGNWIRGASVTFAEPEFTAAGAEAFRDYDFETDDPAYDCIGSSWTRIWLNPNVLVGITQADNQVRLRYEWMDIDRVIPLVDPRAETVERSRIDGMPMLGHSAAWYDGDALVIDTVNFASGYVSTMDKWAGMPQGPRMRTVERLTRSDDLLTIETTHVDPANYQTPLVVVIDYVASDFELMEYGCTPDDAAIVAPE
jgi:hypothetical protein